MRTLSMFLLMLLLPRCGTDLQQPPVIDVDLTQLAQEAASAIASQRRVIQKDPTNGENWGLLGKLYHTHGLEWAAVKSYEYARNSTSDPRTTYLLAVAQAHLGDYQEAIKTVSEVDNYIPALWRAGNWLMDQGKFEEAESRFKEAMEQNPSAVAAIVGLARVHLTRGNAQDAIVLLEGIRDQGGNHPYLSHLLGTAYQRAGNMKLAQPLLLLPRAGQPKWEDPWLDEMRSLQRGFAASLARATAKIDAGNVQGALADLQTIAKGYPREPSVLNNLATVHLQLGNPQKAIKILRGGMRWSPNYAAMQLTMALAYLSIGDLESAESFANRAIELQPAMSAAHALSGRVALAKQDLYTALEYFSQSIAIGNNDPSVREMLALVLLDIGRDAESLVQFEFVLQTSPNRPASIGGAAVAMARLGNREDAIRMLTEAKATFPNDPSIQRALNTVLQLRGAP